MISSERNLIQHILSLTYKMKIKKKKKLPKETYRRWLSKKTVEVFNRYIVLKDKKKCVVCWSTKNPTCGHFVSALCAILRYSEINCHCQCRDCNYEHEFNPLPYSLWMIQNFWNEELTTLKGKRGSSYKWSLSELEEIAIKYCNKVLLLDNTRKSKANNILKKIEEYNSFPK